MRLLAPRVAIDASRTGNSTTLLLKLPGIHFFSYHLSME
jgi:hypothetical protein